MTVQLDLPPDVEERLMAEVRAGRHASLEEAILEKLSQKDELDLFSISGMDLEKLRDDLNDAWNNRDGAIDGEEFFARMTARSATLQAKGK